MYVYIYIYVQFITTQDSRTIHAHPLKLGRPDMSQKDSGAWTSVQGMKIEQFA